LQKAPELVMKRRTAQILACLLPVLSIFLLGMDGDGTGDAGLDGLAARQGELKARIAMLRSEQDLLLFQKQLSAMDSRYLVIDLARGLGQLKYRSRVFLDFTFRPLPKRVTRTVPRGVVALTKKIEGNGRFALVFGTNFGLRTKNAAVPDRGMPQIIVSPREMRSIFFALEAGSVAYIQR
jgi:hypothetical protein